MDLRFTLTAELPNRNLHKFRGKLSLKVTPEEEQQLQQEGLSPGAATLLRAGEIPSLIPENGMRLGRVVCMRCTVEASGWA